MQRHLILLACTIGITPVAHAQGCLPDGIIFTSQAQVNGFPQAHPGCTTIEGYLRIGAGAVTDLAPLAQITAVNGYLQIGANPQLTNLSGLDNITSVGGSLGITGNAQLTDISALSGITTVGGLMEVSANNNLTSLIGLQGINTVGSYLEISDSPGLSSLQGLEGTQTIGGDILINGNPALASMQGLSPSSVGGGLSLMNNPQLMDLSAASGLTSLGGALSLIGNTSILSLEELSGITAVDGLVRVTGSSGLMSLDGLRNIDASTILDLIIVNNPGLFQCAVESLCDYLAIPASMANITGNATGCASRTEVEEACILASVDGPWTTLGAMSIEIFPNPSKGAIAITGDLSGLVDIRVMDNAGRLIYQERTQGPGSGTMMLDLSALAPPGIHVLQVRTEDGMATRMLVRE